MTKLVNLKIGHQMCAETFAYRMEFLGQQINNAGMKVLSVKRGEDCDIQFELENKYDAERMKPILSMGRYFVTVDQKNGKDVLKLYVC